MNLATNFTSNAFSRLLDNAAGQEPFNLGGKITAINAAGIYVYTPTAPVDDYVSLLCQEMLIKKNYLSRRQPVQYLRIHGLPLRQFSSDELTELLFWLCSHFNVLDGTVVERSIQLTPEHCSANNLALLKGLGFNNIRLSVDASIAGPDRSLDAIRQAITRISDYRNTRLSCEISFSSDTSAVYLGALSKVLIDAQFSELEFVWQAQFPQPMRELETVQQLFANITAVLESSSYRALGNKCFKHRDSRDFILMKHNQLSYGPWGFHNAAACDWLGLGIGASGMISGYLYHNSGDPESYRVRVSCHQSPVAKWSERPLNRDQAFEFIQIIYCHQRISRHFFAGREKLLQALFDHDWIVRDGEFIRLTTGGVLNIATIAALYSQSDLA
ncbi:MAG: hypothetical protein WC997_05390 [Porticoccaceae bacterium]